MISSMIVVSIVNLASKLVAISLSYFFFFLLLGAKIQ